MDRKTAQRHSFVDFLRLFVETLCWQAVGLRVDIGIGRAGVLLELRIHHAYVVILFDGGSCLSLCNNEAQEREIF